MQTARTHLVKPAEQRRTRGERRLNVPQVLVAWNGVLREHPGPARPFRENRGVVRLEHIRPPLAWTTTDTVRVCFGTIELLERVLIPLKRAKNLGAHNHEPRSDVVGVALGVYVELDVVEKCERVVRPPCGKQRFRAQQPVSRAERATVKVFEHEAIFQRVGKLADVEAQIRTLPSRGHQVGLECNARIELVQRLGDGVAAEEQCRKLEPCFYARRQRAHRSLEVPLGFVDAVQAEQHASGPQRRRRHHLPPLVQLGRALGRLRLECRLFERLLRHRCMLQIGRRQARSFLLSPPTPSARRRRRLLHRVHLCPRRLKQRRRQRRRLLEAAQCHLMFPSQRMHFSQADCIPRHLGRQFHGQLQRGRRLFQPVLQLKRRRHLRVHRGVLGRRRHRARRHLLRAAPVAPLKRYARQLLQRLHVGGVDRERRVQIRRRLCVRAREPTACAAPTQQRLPLAREGRLVRDQKQRGAQILELVSEHAGAPADRRARGVEPRPLLGARVHARHLERTVVLGQAACHIAEKLVDLRPTPVVGRHVGFQVAHHRQVIEHLAPLALALIRICSGNVQRDVCGPLFDRNGQLVDAHEVVGASGARGRGAAAPLARDAIRASRLPREPFRDLTGLARRCAARSQRPR
eukprot:6202500-Pleurochrysis_carterae.AAC.3